MPEIGVFTMVVMIVLIISITKVLRAKYSDHPRTNRLGVPYSIDGDPKLQVENDRLREEMRGLKDRVAVLERIATDNNRSLDLDREIERLRDRGGSGNLHSGDK